MLRHGSSLSAVRERRIEYELSYDRPTGAGAALPPFKNTLGHFVPRRVGCRPQGRLFSWPGISRRIGDYMHFFASAITTLQTLVIALGAGLGVWGVVNLLEGYGSDNPGSNAHVR